MDLEKVQKRKDLVMEMSSDNVFGNIRIVRIGENEFLFNAKDCALVLEYKNERRAIRKFVPDELKLKLKPKNFERTDLVRSKINNTGEFFITEEGLYRLIAASHMPKAEEFKSWVFGEVLPTFRKTGSYTLDDFATSKFRKTIKNLPGYKEDVEFKERTKRAISSLARYKHMLKPNAWGEFTRLFNDIYGVNLNLKITNFMRKHELTKRPSRREYLDAVNLQTKAHIIFELMARDDMMMSDPENYALTKGLSEFYYNRMSEFEKLQAQALFENLCKSGAVKPLPDDKFVKNYEVDDSGKVIKVEFV